mmetsp:Transcript_23904/g.66240  ORF Transcript_23904/g.66240 Transcript_23904/m.66240 type:complete len:233 (+) Transcript_23904:995-1693(+)
MDFSRRNPSSRYELRRDPPGSLMIWMWSRLPLPSSRLTALTHRFAKYSFSLLTSLLESVVMAIFSISSSVMLSVEHDSRVSRATFVANLHPAQIVWGWMRACSSICSASLRSSPQKTATLVVPSPTSWSCTFATSTKTLAAALSSGILLRMVAPSLVTEMDWSLGSIDCKILSMPFGPSVVLTRSEMAMAPINEDKRALEPFSTSTPWDIYAASIFYSVCCSLSTNRSVGFI